MAIEVHFTVDELRGDLSRLERRLRNQIDPEKYPTFHHFLLDAITYAQNGIFGDAKHIYLRRDGVYSALGNKRYKGHIMSTRIS
ncbi:MAG: hypothetical protein HYT72_04505 [Candidatus Aenigmarchaeota archaeon]|nr:hypothetical protein [Candidatus Aenigmarchaeota archaeon]